MTQALNHRQCVNQLYKSLSNGGMGVKTDWRLASFTAGHMKKNQL